MKTTSSEGLEHRRQVRSFVRRTSRMTTAQRAALEQHWPRFGLSCDRLLNLEQIFSRNAPRFMEVGFGMGDCLIELARARPQHDFIGVEVYGPGIGRILAQVAAFGLENVRVVRGDIVDVLRDCIPPASLTGVMIYFPDPWPKKRHHKRRLVQPVFVSLVSHALAPGGQLQLATDWEDYAVQMREVVEGDGTMVNLAGAGRFAERPVGRPVTKFERRGERLGHKVWDLVFERRVAGV